MLAAQTRPLPRKLRKKILKKGSRGLSAPGSKSSKKRRKWLSIKFLSGFWLVLYSFPTFFRAFLTPGPRGPGNPFSDFVRSFLLGVSPFDPRGRTTSQDFGCFRRLVELSGQRVKEGCRSKKSFLNLFADAADACFAILYKLL